MTQLQSEPRSRTKLFKTVTFSVYIIVLCPENTSNDTDTGLNWILLLTYVPDNGKVSGFVMSFVPGTLFYRQKTKYTKPAA